MAVLSFDPRPELAAHEGPIVIGLVNNMPDKALSSTERQFRDLLTDAAGGRPVRLRIFSLPGIPRADTGRQHVHVHYEPIHALWEADLDGLIVTGTEPRAADLADEPYWPLLTRLIEWTFERSVPSVWSCLASHAAVRHLDGIKRRPLSAKLFGAFECAKATQHPILENTPACWNTPHSRHNELCEEELAAHGYTILSRGPQVGADIFAKEHGALMLFMQGHPEYDARALLREYRRDVGRFLAGAAASYPDLPHSYFDRAAVELLRAFGKRALAGGARPALSEFPTEAAGTGLGAPWRPVAVGIYRNWLAYVSAVARPSHRQPASRAGGSTQRTALPAYA
jgi:homoserine O-succinyltransferase/O-acetyltransferase